jgi:hypothetical protein
MRRLSSLLVALALVAPGPVLAAVANPGAAHAVGAAADDPAPDEFGPCDPSLPLMDENACDDADSLPDPDDVTAGISATVGADRLAGVWIDRDVSPSVLRVGIKDMTAADQAALALATRANPRVQGVAAAFSLERLNRLADQVNDLVATLDPKLVMVSVDIPDNRVEVDVSSAGLANTVTSLVKTLLQSLNLPVAVVKVIGGYVTPDVSATRNTIPPHAGGLNLTTYPLSGGGGSSCTTAYTVQSSGGAIMGLTAGHCATGYLADSVYVGNTYMARSGMNSYRATEPVNSDAMRYSIPSEDLGTRAQYTRIFVNGSGTSSSPTYRKVVSPVYTVSNLIVGTKLCFQGRTSGANNCGLVDKVNISKTTDTAGESTQHVWRMKYPPQHGDSGGPVYHVNADGRARPAGVVMAGAGTNYTYFSHLQYVFADIAVTMIFP